MHTPGRAQEAPRVQSRPSSPGGTLICFVEPPFLASFRVGLAACSSPSLAPVELDSSSCDRALPGLDSESNSGPGERRLIAAPGGELALNSFLQTRCLTPLLSAVIDRVETQPPHFGRGRLPFAAERVFVTYNDRMIGLSILQAERMATRENVLETLQFA